MRGDAFSFPPTRPTVVFYSLITIIGIVNVTTADCSDCADKSNANNVLVAKNKIQLPERHGILVFLETTGLKTRSYELSVFQSV